MILQSNRDKISFLEEITYIFRETNEQIRKTNHVKY